MLSIGGEMHRPTRLKVADINQHFICVLCDGYVIDATTIVECLHSFCRTCIVRYLESNMHCPVCEVQVDKAKPLQGIKSDTTLQEIIYKMIPGLYDNEMLKRREFYAEHPEAAAEEKSNGEGQSCFYSPKEIFSVMLEYLQGSKDDKTEDPNNNNSDDDHSQQDDKKDHLTKYLNCPATCTIGALKKFIRLKLNVPFCYNIEIMYGDNLVIDVYTLMDIAYIYTWKRAGPMKFLYTFINASTFINSSKSNYELLCETPKQLEPVASEATVAAPSLPLSEYSNNSDKLIESKDNLKMEVDDSLSNSASETNTSSKPGDAKIDSSSEAPSNSISPVSDIQAMETDELETNPPKPIDTSPKVIPKVLYNNPRHKVIASGNNLKLKIIHSPEQPPPRSPKHKKRRRWQDVIAVPVQRFPKLAPYPPPAPPSIPATCLTAPLSQITVGKLVPSVMTSLAPNIMTALVSTTANSLCNSTTNTTLQPPAPFLGQVTTCNVVTCNVTTFSTSFSSSLSNGFSPKNTNAPSADTKLSPSMTNSGFIGALPISHVITIPTIQEPINVLPAVTVLPTIEVAAASMNLNPPLSDSPAPTVPIIPEPMSVCPLEKLPIHNDGVSSSIDAPLGNKTALSMPVISVSESATSPAGDTLVNKTSTVVNTSEISNANSNCSIQKVELSNTSKETVDQTETLITKPTPKGEQINGDIGDISSKTEIESSDCKSQIPLSKELNESVKSVNKTLSNNSIPDNFMSVTKSPESLDKTTKNSISAEFSDNDDLGCQPDLVVDEHKMDSSDNEEDENDLALRKKINAIAEKEDEADATDDTEADSGRASDISNQARSSCDDDIGSPMPTTTSESEKKTALAATPPINSLLSAFTLPVSNSSNSTTRNAKSDKINHVINNLYRNHEKKDSSGALDLSTCARKPGEAVAAARSKAVANPVLDTKHKQPTYHGPLSKQHTACVPAPKHPTSSPILMHGLTSRHPILPSQQLHGKAPHMPISAFQCGPSMMYPSQVRGPSTTSCATGSHSTTSPVPAPHPSIPLMPSIMSCMNSPIMNSFPIRSPVLSMPSRSPTSHKGMSSPPIKTPPHHTKQSRKSSALDSLRAKSLTTPNNRNGAMGIMTPGTQASYPKASNSNLRLSQNDYHRSASPAPSPKPMVPAVGASSAPTTPSASSYKPSHSPTPMYKKTECYKTYNNSKFKGSNLAVINPDPNGYRQKIVIRNLGVKSNSNSNHKSPYT